MTVPLRLRLISSKKFEKPIYTVATGDFDGDGRLELAIGCGDGSLQLFKFDRGNLNSVWTTKSWAWIDQIIAADINQDYIDELLVIMGKKLIIYKYKDPTYEQIWEIETNATITSVFVGDSNNNRQNELLICCNDGSITIFAQTEEPFKFKKVWRKKYEGDTLISLGDLDADTLNEMVIANNNILRIFRVIEKYPKKEVWSETFKAYIKKLLLFDLNDDKKSEIFLGMEDGALRIFSHKDGNYFSEDKQYKFTNLVSALASGKIHDKNIIIAGSYDNTLRGFRDAEIFKIETYDKIYALSFSDIDHDGIDEIICASGNNLYILKDEVFLICQIDYPISIFSEKELIITFYIKNNSENRIYNIDFSNLEWVPKILTLKKSTFKIPLLEKYSGVELTFKFDVPLVEKVTPVVFPRFKITFEMKNLQLSQNIPEISVNILPPFSHIAQNILKKCEHLTNIKVPLKSLTKLVEKDLGPLNHDIEQIISRLIEEGFIEGSLSNWVLFIRDLKPFSAEAFKEEYPSAQKVIPPRLFMNVLRKIIKSKKRTLLPELINQYKHDLQEIQDMIKKLKDNFEITGVLIPDEEFLFLSDNEINQIVETINNTPNISLSEIAARFDLLEKEVEFLINDLIDRGMLYGQIITLDNEKKFITVKTLSELLLNELEKQGKITILTYSRKMGLSADLVREAIRTLLDSNQIQGTYTFNGAIFYTQARLEKDLLDTIKISEISSIGLSSLAKDFMISKDTITAILNNLINKQLINGYISENTLFIKSYEEERLRDIFEKYVDALNLIHILIIHKESGIAIFSGSYTTEKIDPVLVSGFLQAITSFGSEISGDHAPFRLLHYKNFKISVQEGQHILGALILKSDPSQRLLDILKHFIRFFETNYREHLQDFRGGIDPFQDADTLVDDFFEISLSFPHEINEKQVFKNRNKLSANDLVLINLARSLGRQFALGTLIELASKEMLISQLEAFSIIYDLRDKNIFYVPSEERKWCPHCGSIIQKSATTCPHCLRNIHETLD